MWNGKNKAVTFSFDDGVYQDERVCSILNKFGLKATFNLNSSLLGLHGQLDVNGNKVPHSKVRPSDVKRIYSGHEVAVHTLTHPFLPDLSEDTIVHQVETDRRVLSELCGYNVVGMAYPCGGENNDGRVAGIIKAKTGVKYARTIRSTRGFDRQNDLYRFDPTIFWLKVDEMFELAERFISLECNSPQLFYIWGHSYEFDCGYGMTDKIFEDFCLTISKKDDIFYGTNREVFGM